MEPRDGGGRRVRPRSADQQGEDVDAIWSVEEAPGRSGMKSAGFAHGRARENIEPSGPGSR